MPPRVGRPRARGTETPANGSGLAALTRELWQAAVALRGSIEPADYKRYVLPIIFLRFLSLRFERRQAGGSGSASGLEQRGVGDT